MGELDLELQYFDEINIKDRLKYPPLQCGTDYIYTILDATECYIEKPLDNDERQRIYSGYKKRTTLKYSVASVLKEPLIIHVSGPFKGRDHDLTMIQETDFFDEFFSNV